MNAFEGLEVIEFDRDELTKKGVRKFGQVCGLDLQIFSHYHFE